MPTTSWASCGGQATTGGGTGDGRAAELGKDPEPGRRCSSLRRGRGGADVIDPALAGAGEVPFRGRRAAALVEIAVDAGDTDARRRLRRPTSRPSPGRTRRQASPPPPAWRGRVLLHGGDTTQALAALSDACRRYQELGAPYDTARVRLLLAEAYQAAGDDTAAAELDEAARTFARLWAASPGRVARPRPRSMPGA